jgi:hypothetical protein
MSCIDDIINGDRVIIGIRNYTECENPESKLFVNDLPGISLKQAANVAPESWETGMQFLQHCTQMAVRHVFDEFANELTPYFELGSIIETREVRTFSTKENEPANAERGIIVKRWRSDSARLFIERVFINVAEAGSIRLKIIDGSNTEEIEFDLEAGLNDLRVEYKAENEQVKIVFNQSEFHTYDGSWTKGGAYCRSCGVRSSRNIYVNGWNGAETSNTYGIGVRAHMRCYEENILCTLIPKMYFLLWYKSGILVLQEHAATNRINHIATFGQDRAKELLTNYQAEYDQKYKTLIRSAYEFLRNTKGDCIKCNGIKYVEAVP